MKFVVGVAAGVALAAAAYVYASRNPEIRAALDGVEGDLRAGDTEALQARLEAGLAEVRSQVQQRFGPQADWADADAAPGLVMETDEAANAAPVATDEPASATVGTEAAPEA